MLTFWITAALANPNPPADQVASELLGRALTSDEAYEELRTLCYEFGARLSGTEVLERAIDWAAEEMRQDGLKVHKEEVLVPAWQRGEETARILTPESRRVEALGLGASVSTPPEGIEGEVLVVDSFDHFDQISRRDVKGKFVLWDVPFTTYGETVQYRSRGAKIAAKKGAIASLIRSVSPYSLYTPHTGNQHDTDGDPPIPAMALTLEDATSIRAWTEAGTPVRMSLHMEAHRGEPAVSHNVIADIPGRERPEEIVLLGCHIDSWDVGHGAHDDGAGCVMVMDAARLIAERPVAPKRTVRVVLFTNEENGLSGGTHYAKHHANERHVAVLEADAGGGDPLGFNVDIRRDDDDVEARDLALALEALTPISDLLEPIHATHLGAGGSGADISPLVDATGVLGLGLRNDMSLYWHIHHTRADTFDKIDPAAMRKNVAAVTAAAWMLAEMDTLPWEGDAQ